MKHAYLKSITLLLILATSANAAVVTLKNGKKIYFASDFHFGIPDYRATREREARVCQWLDTIKEDAQQIYLLGDLFDSWMEPHMP